MNYLKRITFYIITKNTHADYSVIKNTQGSVQVTIELVFNWRMLDNYILLAATPRRRRLTVASHCDFAYLTLTIYPSFELDLVFNVEYAKSQLRYNEQRRGVAASI